MSNKTLSSFFILYALTLLPLTLQADDRPVRKPVTIQNIARPERPSSCEKEATSDRQIVGERAKQPPRKTLNQDKQSARAAPERTERNGNATTARVAVQIPPSNRLHTRPSLKNSRIATRDPSVESRILVNKRPLPARPLPISVKLDRRCVPSNGIILHPFAVKPKGSVIELVDGSIWHIKRKRDRHVVRHWSMRDDIIVESFQFLGQKTYKLVNYSREESVEAVLSLDESYEGRASHWITHIDKNRGVMELEDGSLWNINAALYEDWQENDGVILGLSHESSGLSLYMIINARTMQHIPVTTLR